MAVKTWNVGDSGFVKLTVQQEGQPLRWLWFNGRVVDIKESSVVTLVDVGSERPDWVQESDAVVEAVIKGANVVLVAVSGHANDIHKRPHDGCAIASKEPPPRQEALQAFYKSIVGAEAHFLTASEVEDPAKGSWM